MTEEYVRKSDVVKVLTNNRVHFNDMVKITSEIKALETIKVEKQKPGKWIEICPMVVDGGLAKRIKCSECGDERLDYFISKHYCPNCGAKMEGGSE